MDLALQFIQGCDNPAFVMANDKSIIESNSAFKIVKPLWEAQLPELLSKLEVGFSKFAIDSKDYVSNCQMVDNNLVAIISQSDNHWPTFIEKTRLLHNIFLELSQYDDEYEIYKAVIVAAKKHFNIDRMGILLIEEDNHNFRGTWGTDDEGVVRNEQDYRSQLPSDNWVTKVLQKRNYVEVWQNWELLHFGKPVGDGWYAIAGLWDKNRAFGWIACDNLINGHAIVAWQREILGLFGINLSAIITKLRYSQKLQQMNNHLEDLVDERSSLLTQKINQLETTRDKLVQSEKLASLGQLVAGVSHEVNNPLGISITAASYIADSALQIKEKFENNQLEKSALQEYLSDNLDNIQIVNNNLHRASELMRSFKQLSADSTIDNEIKINLKNHVENVIHSFKHSFHQKIDASNHVDHSVELLQDPGKITQILTNLIKNSLLHGFGDQNGSIEIDAQLQDNNHVCITYKDDGHGVDCSQLPQLFEPFYTTKRNKGGTGLGLNIIHNLVLKMGGEIAVAHNKPKGLLFTISLPVNITENA